MAVTKHIFYALFIIIIAASFSVKAYAADFEVNFDSDDFGQYCSSVRAPYYGWEFQSENQGYRITLLGEDNHPLYIIDLLSKIPEAPRSDASYGFDNNIGFNLGNHELNEIFNGCSNDYGDGPEEPLPCEDGKSDRGFYKASIGGYDRVFNEDYQVFFISDDVSITSILPWYTEDYVTQQGKYTRNPLLSTQNELFTLMQDMKGQCKLYYIQNESNRYLDNGFTPERTSYIRPNKKINTFNNEYRCDRKKVITIDEFNSKYGTNIQHSVVDEYNDFFYVNVISGYTMSSFYDKTQVSDQRFLCSLYNCFMEEMGSDFDISKLSSYSLMFEPVLWFYGLGTGGFYHTETGQHGWQGLSANPGLFAEQKGEQPLYDFYGTITELAFIQMESDSTLYNWRNVIGFVGKEFWRNSHDGYHFVSYDSGAWLWGAINYAFIDGAAMMLRSDNLTVDGTVLRNTSEFANEYPSLEYTNYFETTHSLRGSYIVNNMAVAVLKYHPPVTYFAQDYEYRTNTDVVTSIKLTNNGKENFLPTYASVADYEAAVGGYTEEPVAIGAILEYTDEDGNMLDEAEAAELGLPDFVSVQGIGSSRNFDSMRSAGFETTPTNETYLYFKWRTPDEPVKINITAYFVGDNYKNPIYINHGEDSVAGDNLLYSGHNSLYAGKTFTAVTFQCDIKDTMERLSEDNLPPDVIGGFMDKPSPSASSDELEQYNKNKELFNGYDPNISFDMANYLNDPTVEPEEVKRLNWFEYRAYIDASDNTVKLDMKPYRANSWLRVQEFTHAWTSGGKNPIVTLDNVPQKIDVADNGKAYKFIPSGYGFTFAFEEDYQGRNDGGTFGFYVAPEDEDIVRNACTMFQNGVMLFPEANYSSDYIRTIETGQYDWFDGDLTTYDSVHVLAHNKYSLNEKVNISEINDNNGGLSLLTSRVHFIPVWFPDKTEYKVEVIMFDYWTPAGQIYDHETYTLYIDGNIYDYWYASKSDTNQKK